MEQKVTTFKSFRLEEYEEGFVSSIKAIEFKSLGENEILVKVHYSSLNYKDAL
jgi:NADPH:quinone reductase-like Zn-dependent oxidoreductase